MAHAMSPQSEAIAALAKTIAHFLQARELCRHKSPEHDSRFFDCGQNIIRGVVIHCLKGRDAWYSRGQNHFDVHFVRSVDLQFERWAV